MLDRWRVSSAEYAEFHINIVLAYEQGGSIAAALHPGLAPFSSPLRGFLHCVIPALTERTTIGIHASVALLPTSSRQILACIPLFG
jgi:hypothetical protein